MLTEIDHGSDDRVMYIYKIYIASGYQGLTPAYSLTRGNI